MEGEGEGAGLSVGASERLGLGDDVGVVVGAYEGNMVRVGPADGAAEGTDVLIKTTSIISTMPASVNSNPGPVSVDTCNAMAPEASAPILYVTVAV